MKKQAAPRGKKTGKQASASDRQTVASTDKKRSKPKRVVVAEPLQMHGDIPEGMQWCKPEGNSVLTPEQVAQEYQLRRPELLRQFEAAQLALTKFKKEMKKRPDYKSGHITGFGLQYFRRNGNIVSPLTVVITVHVGKKFIDSDLRQIGLDEIPKSYNGVPVKVLEGRFQLLRIDARLASGGSNPYDPLPFTAPLTGGAPVCESGRENDYGTLGVVLKQGRKWIGLSCGHVVKKGKTVKQRGKLSTDIRDIGTVESSRVGKYTPVSGGIEETIDCARVEISGSGIVFPQQTSGVIRHYLEDSNTKLYFSAVRMNPDHTRFRAWKFGAATGRTATGKIEDTAGLDFDIGSTNYSNNFSVLFDRFNVPDPFAPTFFIQGGDSGAVIALEARVNQENAFVAVGILFGQLIDNKNLGYACNMSHALEFLNIKIPDSRIVNEWILP